jgi:hypothetical protein
MFLADETRDAGISEDRPILADKIWPKLAAAAEPHGALHVPLLRKVDISVRDAVSQSLSDGEPHHDLRSARHHKSPLAVDLQLPQ